MGGVTSSVHLRREGGRSPVVVRSASPLLSTPGDVRRKLEEGVAWVGGDGVGGEDMRRRRGG